MTSPAPDWLIQACRERVAAFADQLRSGVSGTAPVPGLAWTVADLAQHVACLPDFWDSVSAQGTDFEMPDSIDAMSAQARAHITEPDLGVLADLIETNYARYLDDLAGSERGRWLYTVPMSATDMAAAVVNETIVHGRDLAAVTRATVPTHTRDEANAAADFTMKLGPVFIDPVKAATQPDGTYHVKFRGGSDWTWTKRGDSLTASLGKPAKADAHLNADPAAFLLSALGRTGQIMPALTGKIVTYGWKSWRFLGLGNMTRDGV